MVGIIYAIYWWDLDIIYIGQTSLELSKRVYQHERLLKNSSHYNNTVQEAYNLSKNYSILKLDTCSIENLDTFEMYWIKVFNSTNKIIGGANKTYGGGSAGKGILHAKSKYSKILILKVFSMLLRKHSVREILDRLPSATQHLVYDIKNGGGHRWLKEEYPSKYLLLESEEFKTTSRTSGKTYPDFKDSKGNIYKGVTNIKLFCREHPDLQIGNIKANSNDLCKVLRGIRKSCKGFTLA